MKNRLLFKGGYGEHGRSCFLVEYDENFLMLDCGIMDTDINPYPNVSTEVLKKTKYILITHCHKDHADAFDHFVKNGFSGKLITSKPTYELLNLTYENVLLLESKSGEIKLDENVVMKYGKSGHCPGSLWYSVNVNETKYFYSGDYQEDTLVYGCDNYVGDDDFAIIDCAHKDIDLSATDRRKVFLDSVTENLEKGKKVVLPVQKYGRGLEIYYQLKTELNCSIKVDNDFYKNTLALFKYEGYFLKESFELIKNSLENDNKNEDYEVLIVGDTHIEKEENEKLLENELDSLIIISTGRIKKNGILEKWQNEGYVIKKPYSHHQSRIDMNNVIKNNNFKIVYPFHNNELEMIVTV